MKNLLILIILIIFLASSNCYAVQLVDGYFRSNGTYVKPYARKGNNYQYKIPKLKTNYTPAPSYVGNTYKPYKPKKYYPYKF